MSTITIAWTLPTTDVSGNPLPIADLIQTQIFGGPQGTTAVLIGAVPAPGTTFTTPASFALTPGITYQFSLNVSDAAGVSQLSSPVSFTVPEPTTPGVPSPPTNVTVTFNP